MTANAKDFSYYEGNFVPVNEVGSYSYGEFSTKFLAFKATKSVPFSVGANQAIKLILGHGVVLGLDLGLPPDLGVLGLDEVLEAAAFKHLHAHEQGHLEKNALQSSNGNVIDGAGAEFPEELLGPEAAEVVNVVRPQVEHVISAKTIPLFNHDNSCA